VKDRVTVIDQFRQQRTIKDAVDDIPKARHAFEMFDVMNSAGGQVINTGHGVTVLEECFRQM
jgi:hypothetical protein